MGGTKAAGGGGGFTGADLKGAGGGGGASPAFSHCRLRASFAASSGVIARDVRLRNQREEGALA